MKSYRLNTGQQVPAIGFGTWQIGSDDEAKAAGVSNYTVEHLADLAQRSQLVPAVNQVEFHPYIYEQQRAVLEYCRQQDILVEAYSPLSRSNRSPAAASGSPGIRPAWANPPRPQ